MFTADDLVLLNNCLNEVLHGFAVPELEAKLGMSRPRARRLLAKVHLAEATEPMVLWREDLDALVSSIELAATHLGEEEFATRTGYEIGAAMDLKGRLVAARAEAPAAVEGAEPTTGSTVDVPDGEQYFRLLK
jgi:hypothetical protein